MSECNCDCPCSRYLPRTGLGIFLFFLGLMLVQTIINQAWGHSPAGFRSQLDKHEARLQALEKRQ